MRAFQKTFIVAIYGLALAGAAGATETGVGSQPCAAAMAQFERADHLPPKLLNAIGIVESGRVNPHTGVVGPWPFTINVAGKGMAFETAADAISAVRLAQAGGIKLIDVGCMQVNLAYHPDAFASLDEAFDEEANVRYGAAFLAQLHARSGSWAAAIASYHSANPSLGAPYAQTVAAVWRLAPDYGLSAHVTGTGVSLEDEVDPGRVLTPEFRAQMVAALRFQRQNDTAAQIRPIMSTAVGAQTYGFRRKTGAASLASEVDPDHTLTPEFRAQMIEAAAYRHRMEARYGSVGAQPGP